MPDSAVGLFRSRSEAREALRKLEVAGFKGAQVSLSTPRASTPGRYGIKVLAGIAAGVLLGAVVGAIAAGLVPGVHPLVSGNRLATFLLAAVAGTVTGGVAGALFAMAATGPELYYRQEVESGRFLVTVAEPRLDEARAIMRAAGAMESAPMSARTHEETRRPRSESG